MGGGLACLSACSIRTDRMVSMVGARKKLVALLAWLQLVVSLAFAAALLWGYATYHPSLGQFVRSVAASIRSVANVVARSAEILEERGDILDQSAQLLAETRTLINQLLAVAENQSKLAPQHAAGLQSVASVTGRLGGLLQTVGNLTASISVPSGVRFEAVARYHHVQAPGATGRRGASGCSGHEDCQRKHGQHSDDCRPRWP